jgi:hypothetical protein
MKIAQMAPLAESVPPLLYGGTERVVAYLTEELVRRGHEVTCSPPPTPRPLPGSFPASRAPCASIPRFARFTPGR